MTRNVIEKTDGDIVVYEINPLKPRTVVEVSNEKSWVKSYIGMFSFFFGMIYVVSWLFLIYFAIAVV